MKVDDRDPAELKPYPGNPRINDEAIEPVAASIKAYGFRQPIVVDSEDVIIVGHTRHAAALVLGLKSVPVHVAEGLTAEEIRAYRIADNSTGEISTWDGDLLAVELGELQTGGVDLSVMAFPDLDSLVPGNSADEVLEDEIPEPPAEPVTRPGDLWELGGHRVLCGDSTELGQVNRLSPEVDAVVTDPPYGVDYVGKTRDALRVQNDGKAGLEALLRVALEIAVNRCRPGACWYVTAPHGPQFYEFATVLRDLGIWRQTLIWVKQTLVLGHSDYHYQHESILYGWKPGADHTRPPDRKQTSL